ncbi:Aste57867_12624 [Aphanomyces stellatus]|uniref:Aste57867_12624 protein n=1 Tax=Aphanomyces stellatus TaxID=120398 RepID=A0A485KXF1_9STRA|nr:hypothetical protein As57867_012578 [Aphanomyces stellatus]VFT89474.1 Aste57867_12624 [Aphanomyces stellatus]
MDEKRMEGGGAYERLETPTFADVSVDIDMADVIRPTVHAHAPAADESWYIAAPLAKFTVEDAMAMHWDYSNVTKPTPSGRTKSLPSLRGSYRRESDFGGESEKEAKEELGVLLDPFYDVTTSRLRRMFHHFSPQGKDAVTYDEFQKGLLALGISVPAGTSFRDFVRKVDTNGDNSIGLDEFIHCVKMIKQAHLFKPDNTNLAVEEHVLRVVDYSPTAMHAVAPVTKLQSFMFSSKPTWASVRWVHLAGFNKQDDLNLRRLAIKYQLHPLALEDCLNQSDKVRCKYEHYEDHTFLVMPVLRPLTAEKRELIETCIGDHRQAMFTKKQTLARQGGGSRKPSHAVAESDRTAKIAALQTKLDGLKVMVAEPEQLCLFVTKANNQVLSVQPDSDVVDETAFALWDAIFDHNMAKSYSKLRNHGASFLVMSILNAVVDEMLPLVEVFDAKLKMLGKLLRLEQTKFDTKRFARAKKQLVGIEKTVRPLLALIEDQLLDQDEFNKDEVKNYLRDVKDHVKEMVVDLRDHQQTLTALVEEDKQIRAQHQADILYTVSVVAACFLPGTFMTGVYGMNFDNMPELHNDYGYFVWWGVLGVVVICLLAYLKVYKHWI